MNINLINGVITKVGTGLTVSNGSFNGTLNSDLVVEFGTHNLTLGHIINMYCFKFGFDKIKQLMEIPEINAHVTSSLQVTPGRPLAKVELLYDGSFAVEKINIHKFLAENNDFIVIYDIFERMLIIDKKSMNTSFHTVDTITLIKDISVNDILEDAKVSKVTMGDATLINDYPGLPKLVVVEEGTVLGGTNFHTLSPAPYDLDGNRLLSGLEMEWLNSDDANLETKEEIESADSDKSTVVPNVEQYKNDNTAPTVIANTNEPEVEKVEPKINIIDKYYDEIVQLGYNKDKNTFMREYATHMSKYGKYDKDVFFNHYCNALLEESNKTEYNMYPAINSKVSYEEFVTKKNEFLDKNGSWDINVFISQLDKKEESPTVNAPAWDNKIANDNLSWGGFNGDDILDMSGLDKVEL